MENVFDKIQDYANMAEAYGIPESEIQLIDMGLIIIMNAVIFADDVGTWNALKSSSKTWENFQNHFIQAQTSYKANRLAETSATLGYTTPGAQANAVVLSQPEQDLVAANEYIAELEADQAATHQANLVSATSVQTSTTEDTITKLLKKMNDLEEEIKAAKTTSSNDNTNGSNKKTKKKKEKKDRIYCWSHGACAHSGKDCNKTKDGHKKEATFQNMMGGSTKDCYWLPSTSA